ncbi:Sensory box/GGDEF family protein [gamma proteobacterium IMCC2047]|nr:Sensory box/GGDEF family protein [gamma proteobacterium IMCC2047]
MAINLSAKQVYRHDLANVFSKRLREHQIPAKHVHVEITESFLMRDEQAAQAMLKELRKLGIQVWLDDFGTGFSSLSYLRHFQVDGLKIDRSFVADIESDQQDRALTSAIISMARQLHIPVVAEGIESVAQADFLQAEQCDFGQGFLFSEPLPAASFKFQHIREKQRA